MTSISVIICTRDRAESLRKTLESIAVCAVGQMAVEILVVDNGSSDHTKQVVASVSMPSMTLKYLFEPRTGLCFARNTGICASLGNVIMFTDDDVRVPVSWLHDMTELILSGEADAVAGGVVLADHLDVPELTKLTRGMLAVSVPDPTKPPQTLVGANMAFGRQVLAKVPSFDVELGPGASGLGDDTLFGLMLRKHGYRIAWSRGTPVVHHCDVSRLNSDYALEWMRKSGRSQAIMSRKSLHDAPRFVRFRLLWQLARRWIRVTIIGDTAPGAAWRPYYEFRIAYYRELLCRR
jgi:glucosyl-dolichyl phosphate glucuronosyltransferase